MSNNMGREIAESAFSYGFAFGIFVAVGLLWIFDKIVW